MKRQDELNEAWCKYMGKCSTEIMQALAFALRWADAHPRWISINDELPNEDGMYIFLQSGIIYTAMYYKSIGLHRDITHWMPLPQPPKKGGEE